MGGFQKTPPGRGYGCFPYFAPLFSTSLSSLYPMVAWNAAEHTALCVVLELPYLLSLPSLVSPANSREEPVASLFYFGGKACGASLGYELRNTSESERKDENGVVPPQHKTPSWALCIVKGPEQPVSTCVQFSSLPPSIQNHPPPPPP
eukprot:Sspe_Gene.90664::Locus_62173_Transcript_1_1_Confidence_1.000_Length_478::g.90664::m.90664